MKLFIRHFCELSVEELFEIYKLRTAIFVVEQKCPYQEVDDADKNAYHVYLKDRTGIQAYLRVLPKGIKFEQVSLGRVLAAKRHCGLGSQIIAAGIQVARDRFDADRIVIEAQVHARKFYERAGFVPSSSEFLEDGIPHIQTVLPLK